MAEKLSHGVIVAVVGAVAGAVLVPAWGLVRSFGSRVWSKAQIGWAHLLAPSQWPNGAVYLCALLAAFFLIALAVDLVASRRKTPSWRSYTHGTYLGVDWTWSYSGSDIARLTPFCPVCRMALQYEETDPMRRVLEPSRVCLVCTDCGGRFADQPGTFKQLLHQIALFIERDVRTGEFAKRLKGDQPGS